MQFFDFIRNNLAHATPILLAAFFAGAIIVERSRTLFKTYSIPNAEGLFEQIKSLVSHRKLNEALALCNQYPGKPSAELIKSGLERAHQPEELIINALEISRGRYAELIQKRTHYLATLANVATLLGLVGTIAGLIESFAAVGHADAQQKAALLANGISTAMNATMLGLAVAIPCMVVFSFFINKSNQLMAQLETAGMVTLDSIMLASMHTDDSESLESEQVAS